MERKHTVKIIALFALMFMSLFGNTTSELLNAGVEYGTTGGQAFLLSLASMALSTVYMMVVPLIFRISQKRKLPYKSGRKLCMWNSIILFILSFLSFVLVCIQSRHLPEFKMTFRFKN